MVNEFSQLEHRHLFPTAEHGQKFFVRVDVCFLLWILEAMFTDIFPDLFGELGTRKWRGAYDGRQRGVRLDRFS